MITLGQTDKIFEVRWIFGKIQCKNQNFLVNFGSGLPYWQGFSFKSSKSNENFRETGLRKCPKETGKTKIPVFLALAFSICVWRTSRIWRTLYLPLNHTVQKPTQNRPSMLRSWDKQGFSFECVLAATFEMGFWQEFSSLLKFLTVILSFDYFWTGVLKFIFGKFRKTLSVPQALFIFKNFWPSKNWESGKTRKVERPKIFGKRIASKICQTHATFSICA